ncbi:2-C-methyl-D-erythritol 2,4-cyclodiphosphate synthase [Sulfurihydrogenibium azorense]|uniref:2-C-methyl-D-erythritol 2,4-cyclodiphosphate synthase n=1 Tax=Sulfurihydrogenibium azorense (strain DSM 15241 / OCM 825 / Az-Fu1) TaxID=204536 RepID=C1DU19_SULAA|nr:2-C-methyl-D-erythritol 2,4-cyclodiphosphate synthase [Sulfurihydrogenibium azorense]ACN99015.1 2C-methyl-D-erythritol 2,4-cyclodiphosphate synthase [Sulfurihydrogenibium azorense Az-Fu1]MDM7273941.1 2-C-methyl-D-erythritol 2,4-cyclodiphosphate synthase [Sulfurihydrogenibium azorense]
MEIRVGIGYDLHKLEEGRKLIIAGVEIPSDKGFLAHSDGDIFFHALTDALLGAVGYGDIGQLFPDSDKKFKDASSEIFLKEAKRIIDDKKYKIVNIDGVIIIEKPKILPYREKMIENTAKILEIEKDRVFLKAKTNEKMDSIGKQEAAACYVVVLLKKEE